MPSTRDIRRRIKSIKNTAQITKAMQMVAASKMRRAQDAAMAGRPYAELMNRMLAEVTATATDFQHPLLENRTNTKKRAVILVSTDKGLCGGLNTNLLRDAAQLDKENSVFICAGRKGAQFVGRTRRELTAELSYADVPEFSDARTIAKFGVDLYTKGTVDAVDVLFTNFISTINQKPELRQLLPIVNIKGVEGTVAGDNEGHTLEASGQEFLFEPDAPEVLSSLLPHYINYQLFQILLESKASEHSSRMVAMKNATDNANQIIKDLTLEYNKIRQASITSELLEITTAQMALG
ncbi:MAG: ATP synthase F1 subunit gamma [Opitutia bacterium TMED67]|nr:ATP synthase F1 subunit gamma [Verrucomicrobiales bacterium]OUU78069.1 MAG: ATP synthase F1 subunit gamma [Opitutae bacterium TMED67]